MFGMCNKEHKRFLFIVIKIANKISNFMEIQPFRHSSGKFYLLCCMLLNSYFNENKHRQIKIKV